MKILIAYSSMSGGTKRLAEGIYNAIEAEDKTILNVKEVSSTEEYDCILTGYWVDKGGPNGEAEEFLKGIKNKYVGVFCTIGYYCDSSHGTESVKRGVDILSENNRVIGSYVCNGALSPKVIEVFRSGKVGEHHRATPESEIRWKFMASHPTANEIALAGERFNERIGILKEIEKNNLNFKSIV